MGNGDRCLHPGLDRVQGLCKSPMEPCGKSSDTCQEPTGSGDTDSPCLESTGLVHSLVGDVDSGTTPAPRMLRSGITNSQVQQTRHNPPASHMGYLREKLRDQNLSEEALKLFLASWRQKLHGPMIPCLGNGFAAVTRGIKIQFRVI